MCRAPQLFGLVAGRAHTSLEVHAEYRVRAFSEPRNGRMADVIGSADLSHGLASFPSRQRFEDLVTSELGFATEGDAPGLCADAAFAGPRKDEGALELCKPTKDRYH
jgi:hypothetical protein